MGWGHKNHGFPIFILPNQEIVILSNITATKRHSPNKRLVGLYFKKAYI